MDSLKSNWAKLFIMRTSWRHPVDCVKPSGLDYFDSRCWVDSEHAKSSLETDVDVRRFRAAGGLSEDRPVFVKVFKRFKRRWTALAGFPRDDSGSTEDYDRTDVVMSLSGTGGDGEAEVAAVRGMKTAETWLNERLNAVVCGMDSRFKAREDRKKDMRLKYEEVFGDKFAYESKITGKHETVTIGRNALTTMTFSRSEERNDGRVTAMIDLYNVELDDGDLEKIADILKKNILLRKMRDD